MNILIVDDSVLCRQSAAEVLAPLAGMAPRQVDSVPAAWQALVGGYRVDLVVVDVRMPQGGGLELLDRLRQDLRFAPVPVMMITGTPEQGVVRQAMQIGVQGFILKPLGPDVLVRVRAVMDRFQATLVEPAASACRRQALPQAQYWHSVLAVRAQLQQLIDALAAVRQAGAVQDITAQRSALRRLLEPCVTVTRTLGMTLARPLLTAMQRLLAINAPFDDARYEEMAQALDLHQHWLLGYCRGRAPSTPMPVAARSNAMPS